ncbi:MAG: hypothetical protein KFF50_16040, partial [Desulfatitalea sp.]|nr:hypothetical protein [Desulfatitalea sp.]
MTDLIVMLLIAYVLVGVMVYALTDTTGFASRVESLLVVFPFGMIENHLFVFVVAFWPIWFFFGG